MTPPKVLNAIHEQLKPLIYELAKYNISENDSILMEFDVGTVLFEFKK